MQRNISGIYFRYQNPDTGKWENWAFEDLPEEAQKEILETKNVEFIKGLAIAMAKRLKEIAEQFDIVSE